MLVCDLHKNSKNNLSLLKLFKAEVIERLLEFSKNIKISFYNESNCVSTPGEQSVFKNQKTNDDEFFLFIYKKLLQTYKHQILYKKNNEITKNTTKN